MNLNTRSRKEIVITVVDKENSDRAGVFDNPKEKNAIAQVISKLIKADKESSVITDVDGWEWKDENIEVLETVGG